MRRRSGESSGSSPCAPSHLASDVAGRDAAAAAWSCLGECAAGAVAHLCKQLESIVEAHHRYAAMCVRACVRGITRAPLRVCALAHVLRMWDANAYRGRSAGGTPSICHPPLAQKLSRVRERYRSAHCSTVNREQHLRMRARGAHRRKRNRLPRAKRGSGAALPMLVPSVRGTGAVSRSTRGQRLV